MKRKFLTFTLIALLAFSALTVLFWFAGETRAAVKQRDLPGLSNLEGLSVTKVQPDTAPNDIDTPIVIQGSGFSATISGTQVISAPLVYLGEQELSELFWVNTATLSATVPWGLQSEVYSLTVVNPDGVSVTLQSAFTIAQGLNVWTTNGPYGGSIAQIVLHPRQSSTIFALGWDVGIFVSEDAARNWEMAFRKPSWNDVYAFDAQDDAVIYAGDDHALYRTLDGAQTWDKISVRPDWWEHTPATHPTISGTVYVAVGSYLNPDEIGGVFRSDDYGDSWITLTVGVTDTHFSSLASHPVQTQTLVAGTINGNIFYSLDGGQNWTWSANITDTVAALYINPFEPLEVWATTGMTTGDEDTQGLQTLYKSTDLLNWDVVTVDTGLRDGNRFGWDVDFVSDTIWATTNGTYTSTNGGATWAKLPDGGCHPGRWLAVNPEDPSILYSGNELGVCLSTDSGLHWSASNEGLAALVPAQLAVDPFDPDTLYVRAPGLDLAKSESGGQSWRVLNIGLGGGPHMGLAVDPFDPERVYVNTNFSTDGGQSWLPMTFTTPITSDHDVGLVTALAPHPITPGHLLAGYQESEQNFLCTSTDYGEHWNCPAPPSPLSKITQVAYDAGDTDLVYAATWENGLWQSQDGGQTWEDKTPSEDYPQIWQLFTHPAQPGTVYAHTRQPPHGAFQFVISTDGGQTWSIMPEGASGPFHFAPTQPTSLYSACGAGNLSLCRSWDGGYTWEIVHDTQQEITVISSGTDGERVIIYVGTKGGSVSSSPRILNSGLSGSLPGLGSLLGGGVYRLTTLLPTDWVYLPIVLR